MNLENEKQLVEKAKESLKAFDELYEYYLPKIFGYIMNRTGNKEITEDIVSEVFITTMTKLSKFKDKGYGFSPWIYTIAHNTLVDYFRKHKEKLTTLNEDIIEQVKNETNEYEQIDNKIYVRRAMLKLPEQYQQILSLKYFEEFDNSEIANIVGCKKETLAVKLHRSLEAFKKIIDNENNLIL